jgi:hypothetical protein
MLTGSRPEANVGSVQHLSVQPLWYHLQSDFCGLSRKGGADRACNTTPITDIGLPFHPGPGGKGSGPTSALYGGHGISLAAGIQNDPL